MTTDRRFVLAGIALLAIGMSAGLVAAVSVADAQARHDAGCIAAPTGAQSSPCVAIESEIHTWQAVEYLAVLGGGAGAWLLVGAVLAGPRRPVPLPDRGYAGHS